MRLAGDQLRLPGEPVAVAVSRPLETTHHQHAASPAPPASRRNLFYAAARLALHPLQLAPLRTGHLLRVSLGPFAGKPLPIRALVLEWVPRWALAQPQSSRLPRVVGAKPCT